MRRDQLSLLSAAVAFYALLALFPALIGLVSLYGLLADPSNVEAVVDRTGSVLPPNANALVAAQLHDIIKRAPTGLGLSFFIALVLAMWTTSTGVVALLRAVRYAHRVPPLAFVALRGRALLLTLATQVFGVALLVLLVVVPVFLSSPVVPESVSVASRVMIAATRWPTLILLFGAGVYVVYRTADVGVGAKALLPGVFVATVLWILSSYGFTTYVEGFASYNRTYGTLGAVVVLQMWLFLTAFSTLVGAELNAAITDVRNGAPVTTNAFEVQELVPLDEVAPAVDEGPPSDASGTTASAEAPSAPPPSPRAT